MISMKRFVGVVSIAFLAAVGMSSGAQAVTEIDIGASAIGNAITYKVPVAGEPLQDSTSISFGTTAHPSLLLVTQTGPGDGSGLTAGSSFVTLSPVTITFGSGSGMMLDTPLGTDITKSWTDSVGTFTETLTTVDAINRGSANAITVTLLGTIVGPGLPAGGSDVQFILTANQAGGVGKAVSASFTNTANLVVPEPSTWAMMVVGFIGLGYAAFRRSAKNRTFAAI